MFDANRLLDQFLGTGQRQAPPAGAPPASAPPPHGHPHTGYPQPGAPPQGAAPGQAGLPSWAGVAGGALAGGLAGVLMGSKKGRKVAGTVATYGGMAAVAGLAYKAYRDWQANKPPASAPTQAAPGAAHHAPAPPVNPDPAAPGWTPAPADGRFLPTPDQTAQAQDLGRLLLRAMIMATKADGHIDGEEYRRIFAHLDTLNLEPQAKAFVMDELNRPMDLSALTQAATSPEIAAEIYAASLLAIDPDGAAERGYLAMLAAQMRLEPALVEHLHASVAASTA